MRRPRVVIRAFTRRRDVASACLLAKLLEKLGCDALVAGSRDYQRVLRYWNPEVVVVNTRSQPRSTNKFLPNAKIVLIDAEGLSPPVDSIGRYFAKNPDVYEITHRVLVWGERHVKEIIESNRELDLSKVVVVGNPHFDLVKYMPKHIKYDPGSKSVGVVMRFRSINDHAGRPTIQLLPSEGNLEDTIAQCKDFVGLIKAIRMLLEKTDFTFEIRPHPLEQIESYKEYIPFWFGSENAHRVTVDERVSFSQFAVRHRALLSPTTTSFMKAYLLKVPVINMDILCGTVDHNLELELGDEWVSASLRPRNNQELIDLLTAGLPAVEENEAIERQLVEYCDYYRTGSACHRVASLIAGIAKDADKPKGVRLPAWLLDGIDEFSFRTAMRKNPLHHNMNHRRGFHKPPDNLEEMVSAILEESS